MHSVIQQTGSLITCHDGKGNGDLSVGIVWIFVFYPLCFSSGFDFLPCVVSNLVVRLFSNGFGDSIFPTLLHLAARDQLMQLGLL